MPEYECPEHGMVTDVDKSGSGVRCAECGRGVFVHYEADG